MSQFFRNTVTKSLLASEQGASLTGSRGITVQDAIDNSSKNMKLHRLKTALSKIAAGVSTRACLMFAGDSICRSLVPDQYVYQLYRQYGYAGHWASAMSAFGGTLYSLYTGGFLNGSTIVNTCWSTHFNGSVFLLTASGHAVQFSGILGNTFNKATLVYTKRSGGGVFKLQTFRQDAISDTTDWVDVAGAEAIDTSNATEVLATLVVNMPANESARVRAAWVSGGEVEIVGCLIEDTTASGMVIAYVDRGGIDQITSANAMTTANRAVLLNLIAPDLVYWSAKDINTDLPTVQAAWDASYPTDWLFSAPYPDSTSATQAQARANAQPVIDHAISNGHDYFDPLIECPTYAYGVAQGWFADGTHFNSTAGFAIGGKMWRSTGLLPNVSDAELLDTATFDTIETDVLVIDGKDQVSRNTELLTASLSTDEELTILAGGYIVNYALRPTTIDANPFTMIGVFRVPSTPGAISLMSLRSTTFGGPAALDCYLTVDATKFSFTARTAGNVLIGGNCSVESGSYFWGLAGQLVTVAVTRNPSPATGVSPVIVTVNGRKFPVSYAGTPTDFISGTYFQIGFSTAGSAINFSLRKVALYLSVLTDAQIQKASSDGYFPSGAEIGWNSANGYEGSFQDHGTS